MSAADIFISRASRDAAEPLRFRFLHDGLVFWIAES